MAMGDRRPVGNSPPSRLTGLPPLQSFASGSSNAAGMRLDTYATAPGGLSQPVSMSPTLERRTQDRAFPPLSSSISDPAYVGLQPSIRIRVPRNFEITSLRMLLVSVGHNECYIVNSDDSNSPYSTAIATFNDIAQARSAQDVLNDKPIPGYGINLMVEVSNDDDQFGSRRNTIDGIGHRHHSVSGTSSASSNNYPLVRHSSTRYSFSVPTKNDGSPPMRSPEGSANAARMASIFSSTSPNGISGNSLLNEDRSDDDGILNEITTHTMNGHHSASRRTANQDTLTSSFNGLTLATNLPNGNVNGNVNGNGSGNGFMSPSESGFTSPRPYSAVQSPSTGLPATNNVPNGGWGFARQRQSMPPANPADQNPPCNTLYVGNLPPNTTEEELKTLFTRQRGYRRLCFRAKNNGPMCFVEFEDINYAAQALDTLYGTMLTNSVKGGIRLSFSKNPLGVRRDQGGSNSPMSPQALVAGFSSSGAPFATANGPPPGLPVPAPRGQPSFNQTSPHNNAVPVRGYNNGVGPTSPTYSSGMRSPPNGPSYHNNPLNGHFAGLSNGQQPMFGGYPSSTNGSLGGMTNGNPV